MAFDFEALIGYLYVVGGRGISTAPPGTLCEAAPLKAARGREAETFFVLVTPSGDSVHPSKFYERLATLASERYFASTGSVTAGLRDLFAQVNSSLYEHNQSNPNQPHEANMICAVLRGADLIVARCGASVAVLRHEGRTRTFPEDWTDDDALYTKPLGIAQSPDIRLTQYRVNNGTRIAFGDANLADLTLTRIDHALLSVDLATVLVSLKELAKLQLSVMVAEFVPPTAPVSPTVPIVESTGLVAGAKRETDEATDHKAKKRERQPSVLGVLWRHGLRAMGRLLMNFGKVFGVFSKLIDRYFGPDSDGQRRWLSSPVGLGTVLVIPIIAVALVLFLWLGGTNESQFEICLQELNARYELARSPQVVNSDRQRMLDTWGHVQAKVEECGALRPNDLQVETIRSEGQQVTDRLERITRIEPVVIQSIPQAELTRIVAQGRNLFVLDSANGRVYQVALSDDGLSASSGYYPIPQMWEQASPNGYQMGRIFDIAYSPNADRLISIADNGVLVQCEVRWWDCRAERLIGVEQWISPEAFTIWRSNGNLYILDSESQNGQIWRYEVVSGSFSSRAPTEAFTGASRPVLRAPRDVQIDGNGNIYILMSDGVVSKYHNGQLLDNFNHASFPESQRIVSAQGFLLDDSPTAQNIYIVNRDIRTIFETTLSGNFRASYRTTNEALFNMLSDVAVITDANRQEIMYAVSGNTIFALPKPN
jgi:serine/threonine protein phosphatase PrpC